MTEKNITAKATISISTHNIKAIKRLIYDTLKSDTLLVSLLNGVESIYQNFPNTKEIAHPAIFYSIVSEGTYPYNEDDAGSNMSELVFGIEIVDDSSNPAKSDDIENRIFALFNGKNLKNSEVVFKQPCKRSYYFQYFDSEIRVWRTVLRFTTVTATI